MKGLSISFFFVTKLPKGVIVSVFNLVVNFVHLLLIRSNLLSRVLFVSRKL